jgi:hypothetical protein
MTQRQPARASFPIPADRHSQAIEFGKKLLHLRVFNPQDRNRRAKSFEKLRSLPHLRSSGAANRYHDVTKVLSFSQLIHDPAHGRPFELRYQGRQNQTQAVVTGELLQIGFDLPKTVRLQAMKGSNCVSLVKISQGRSSLDPW